MKEQVLSIERMQHLKKLGLSIGITGLHWVRYKQPGNEITFLCTKDLLSQYQDNQILKCEIIPTYTLQDLFEMIPERVSDGWHTYEIEITGYTEIRYIYDNYCDEYDMLTCVEGEDILDAAYKMLCWLAENKLLRKEEEK